MAPKPSTDEKSFRLQNMTIAAPEADTYRHNGEPIESPLKPFGHIFSNVWRKSLIGSPWCREARVPTLEVCSYPERNLSEILIDQTEIILYLPFSDWFGTEWVTVWFRINRKMVNTIWFRFDLIRFLWDLPEHVRLYFTDAVQCISSNIATF